MPEDCLLSIGELARRTGVATSALRYYERIGLLAPAERAGRQRRYTASSAERVALIHLCQDAGFTLAEIGELHAAWSRGHRGWEHLAQGKIAQLDARIRRAQRAKKLIQHAVECPHPDILTCPNFHAAVQAQLKTTAAGASARASR
jgi:DNA-binding transcriptional MerR regulator